MLGYADAAQAPQEFTTAPAQAIPKALSAARVAPSQVYCYEINEAFSIVDLVNRRLLQLDPERCVVGALLCCRHALFTSKFMASHATCGCYTARETAFVLKTISFGITCAATINCMSK